MGGPSWRRPSRWRSRPGSRTTPPGRSSTCPPSPSRSARTSNAERDFERAIAFAKANDLTGYVTHLLGNRALLRLTRGDWDGAERDAREALAERALTAIRMVEALVALGLLQTRRGDPEAAATLQEATERALATTELQWTVPVAAARAEYAWLHGDDAPGRRGGRGHLRAGRAGRRILAGRGAGHVAAAGRGAPREPVAVAEPYRLLLAGDWRASADAWRELGRPYHRALALGCGDRDEALLEALSLLDGLGARQTAQRLRRQLRQRGNLHVPRGPTRATAANPAGLTGRQVEVLGLLAQGLSNPEIAARLSLSAKTVEHHVSALLAKLGAGSRREATAAARRLGIVPVKK